MRSWWRPFSSASWLSPLATAFARTVGDARSVRQRVEGEVSTGSGSGRSEGWEWGPRVIAAWWRPGPVLHVRVSGTAGQALTDAQVGLWADGWLVAEEAITINQTGVSAMANDVQIGPEFWTGMAESELVIRARVTGGAWGPPWRLAVPGAGGGTPAPGSVLSGSQQGPTVVVHRPGNRDFAFDRVLECRRADFSSFRSPFLSWLLPSKAGAARPSTDGLSGGGWRADAVSISTSDAVHASAPLSSREVAGRLLADRDTAGSVPCAVPRARSRSLMGLVPVSRSARGR